MKNIVRVKSVLPLPSCSQDGRLYVKCFHSKEIFVGHDWYQELESEVFSVFLSTCLFNGSWASSGGQNHEQCRHDHTIYFTMRYCLRYAVWNVFFLLFFSVECSRTRLWENPLTVERPVSILRGTISLLLHCMCEEYYCHTIESIQRRENIWQQLFIFS